MGPREMETDLPPDSTEAIPPVEMDGNELPTFSEATTTTEDEVGTKKKAKRASKPKKPPPAAKPKVAKPAKVPAKATDPAGKHNYPAKRAKAGEGKTRFIGVLIHTSEETLKRIDRKVAELQKKSPDSRISRSSFVRGLIDKATAA